MPYDKGDFTQQGVDGYVNGGLLLNNKRDIEARLSTDEETEGIDDVNIVIKDHLNNLEYYITGENLVVGENVIGGGGVNLTVPLQTLEIPETVITGVESDGFYYSATEVGTAEQGVVPLDTITIDGVTYDYRFFADGGYWEIDGVELGLDIDMETGKLTIRGSSISAYTITFPATTIHFYRASEEVAETFRTQQVLDIHSE